MIRADSGNNSQLLNRVLRFLASPWSEDVLETLSGEVSEEHGSSSSSSSSSSALQGGAAASSSSSSSSSSSQNVGWLSPAQRQDQLVAVLEQCGAGTYDAEALLPLVVRAGFHRVAVVLYRDSNNFAGMIDGYLKYVRNDMIDGYLSTLKSRWMCVEIWN